MRYVPPIVENNIKYSNSKIIFETTLQSNRDEKELEEKLLELNTKGKVLQKSTPESQTDERTKSREYPGLPPLKRFISENILLLHPISICKTPSVISIFLCRVPKKYGELPPQKSLCVAYFLWLVGGYFGLHHLYLHRDRQAFLWWCTLGGYFGIGWLCEITQIPEMVRDVNEDPEFIERFINRLQMQRKPEFSTSRFLFAIMIGYLWSQLVMIAIPGEIVAGIDWSFLHWAIPLAGALGKYETISYVPRLKVEKAFDVIHPLFQ